MLMNCRPVSFQVVTQGGDLVLAYLPEFRAKIETESKLIPRSFPLKPLPGIMGSEEEEHLSPVRAVKYYIDRTKDLSLHPCSLFVSPSNPTCSISKNALSFFLRETISGSQVVLGPRGTSSRPRALSVGFGHVCVVLKELVDSECFRYSLLGIKFSICIILP